METLRRKKTVFAIKRFMVMLLYVLLCVPLTQAQPTQDKQQDAQATNPIAQDVLIIIQQEKVRFTAQKTVEEMRLEIFDQAGELVYDSGVVTEPELNWPLQNSNGETVKSGLYAYTLSIKEEGAETARVRRGHFIVDRAKERDGKTDRLWITSQSEDGVGTELTVARNDETTIAGTSSASERVSGKDGDQAQHEREGDDKTKSEKDGKPKSKKKEGQETLAVDGTGTPGQIAKFTSAEGIGDSGITELDGNVGIGTANPARPLEIATGRMRLSSNFGDIEFTEVADLIAHATTPNPSPTDPAFRVDVGTNLTRAFTVLNNGNVGIGTTNPLVRLMVVANSDAVWGESTYNAGVVGRSRDGRGVVGTSTTGTGVEGRSSSGYAGRFEGNVRVNGYMHVNGRLTKSSGSFKIDHPLDPANKYLSHSFVESPDMMNIYNGIVTLDRRGRATVTLPAYFEALNRDFRYQLTAVGAPGPSLYVAEKIKGNRFRIAGGKRGMEVSWQVTGVRQDAYAKAHRIKVEEEKTGAERGTYLHPEAFGQPKEKGVERAQHAAETQRASGQ